MDTGSLKELKTKYSPDEKKKIDNISELLDINGLGYATVRKYVKQYGILDLKSLKRAIRDGEINPSRKVILGIKYHGKVMEQIPRKYISNIEKYLKKIVKRIDKKLELIICGSYRRGKATSGDIDIIIYHPEITKIDFVKDPKKYKKPQYLDKFIHLLTQEGFLQDDIDLGYITKYMGYCKYEDYPIMRIDIRNVPMESLAASMLYFTGPHQLNTLMRSIAKGNKMNLNEWGIYTINPKTGDEKLIKTETEHEIFDILGMKYFTPKQREKFNTGKK